MVNGSEATEAVFMGNGTVNGINVTSTGTALVIPRSNGAAYIEGTADFKTTHKGNGGKAIYGAAFFNSNSTGSLGFLNNMVGIYKVDMNEDGDNVFTMWNWRSPNN